MPTAALYLLITSSAALENSNTGGEMPCYDGIPREDNLKDQR